MTVQELYWVPSQRNRKTGELRYFRSKEELIAAVATRYESVHVEATDKARGFTGQLLDIPNGSYDLRGPNHKRTTWTATLTVTHRSDPIFVVV